jgi:hypothetical protein
MGKLQAELAEAERHVAEAQARVARQRELVARLAAGGSGALAVDETLLGRMEAALAVLRLRRDHLREEVAGGPPTGSNA